MPRKTNNATLISQKRLRSCLRISIIVLFILYVSIMLQISYLEHDVQMKNASSIIGVPMPSKEVGASQERASSSSSSSSIGCAYTLLYYYTTSSLLWTIIVFWKRQRRKPTAILINMICLVVIYMTSLQSNEYCRTTSLLELADVEGPAIIAKTVNTRSWYNNYSPKQHTLDGNVRISFRLHDPNVEPLPDKFAGVVGYKCSTDKGDLPPKLSKSTILNFTTSISTDLKILFLGDSLAEQFSQSYDASLLGKGYEQNRLARTYRNGANYSNVHNCLSVSAPIRGGGITAFWRIVTLMSLSTHSDNYVCEHYWKSWSSSQALDLIQHRYVDPDKEGNDGTTMKQDHNNQASEIEWNTTFDKTNLHLSSVDSFDAIVMRIPHGWLTLEQITRERIIEAITLSNEHVGAQTIIISTLPLNNNVVTTSDWQKVTEINHMLRNIARTWNHSEPGKVKYILIQEFGNFTNQILRMNAEHIQMTNTSTPDFTRDGWELSGAEFLLKRLSAESFWAPSICMVCAQHTYHRMNDKNNDVEDCVRNKISRDGIHWCVETVGPRYSASIACLLGCVYNGNEPDVNVKEKVVSLRQCEQKCNDKFMSILPVDKRWIQSDMSLFSKSL